MNLYEFIDECLCRVGVENVFGIPGSLIMPIWQNIKNKNIVLCSHEQEASYVAVGYAKMSRKPVCVITTGGPGVTNCISGIASANIDSVPLIYISGRTPVSKNGSGLMQEESRINRMFDSVDLLKSVVKTSVCIENIETAPQIIWETIRSALEGRSGAVHLSIPIDIQNAAVSTENVVFSSAKSTFDEPLLTISEKPLFVIGWGCWLSDSFNEVYSLSEKVNAPVVVSSKAYCCINRNHDMFLGKLGYGNSANLEQFIAAYQPDSIVAFGSSLGDKDFNRQAFKLLKENVPVYIITNDNCSGSQKINGCTVIETSDMKGYLNKVLSLVERRTVDENFVECVRTTRNRSIDYWKSRIAPRDYMARYIEHIGRFADNGCVITADAGNHLVNAGALVNPAEPGQMFLDVGLRAMGIGICTAVGMAIANPKKKYLAITGDGCMLMNGNVMHLTRELNLPVLFIVFNNHSLGRVRVGQSLTHKYRGSDINNVDFQAYAKSFGLDAYRFDSPEVFFNRFPEILSHSGAGVVEVITSKDEIPIPIKDNIY